MASGTGLEDKIVRELNEVECCRAVRQHGGRYSRNGTPDIAGAFLGLSFRIEVKSGSATLQPTQKIEIQKWRDVGVFCEVAREDFDVGAFLRRLVEHWKSMVGHEMPFDDVETDIKETVHVG